MQYHNLKKFFALSTFELFSFILTLLPTSVFLLINLKMKRPVYITRIVTEAIGHFAFETDLKLAKMKNYGGSKLLVINYGKFSNFKLKKKFIESGNVIFAPKIIHISLNFLLNNVVAFRKLIPFEEINFFDPFKYENTPPQINLNEQERSLCVSSIKKNAPFLLGKPLVLVCIRDSKYDEVMNRDPENRLSYRNSNPDNFIEISKYLTHLGYAVIRMGRSTNTKLSEEHSEFLFDYAYSNLASELMDLYLFSECDFVISTEFGLDELGTLFRKPVLIVNLLPLYSVRISRFRSIILPKVLIDLNTHQPLSLKEIASRNISNAWSTYDYLNANVGILENTPFAILEFIKEALQVLNSNTVNNYYSDEETKNLSVILPVWWPEFRIPVIGKNWVNLGV